MKLPRDRSARGGLALVRSSDAAPSKAPADIRPDCSLDSGVSAAAGLSASHLTGKRKRSVRGLQEPPADRSSGEDADTARTASDPEAECPVAAAVASPPYLRSPPVVCRGCPS